VVRRAFGRAGASKFGCLLSLVLFVGALTYGLRIGRVYWRYYELVDEMKTSARMAQLQNDEAIRRGLVVRIDQLSIPSEAKRYITIRRAVQPPWRILIRTEYRERIDLPVGQPRYILFKPTVEQGF
jgi:hypothetical protein